MHGFLTIISQNPNPLLLQEEGGLECILPRPNRQPHLRFVHVAPEGPVLAGGHTSHMAPRKEVSWAIDLCSALSTRIFQDYTHAHAQRTPRSRETLGQGPSPKGHLSVMCHTIRKREQTARAHPPPRLQPRQTSPIHHRAPSRRAQSRRGMLESPRGLALQKDSFARSRGRLPVLGGGGQHEAPFLEPMAALSAGFMH